MSHFVPKNLPDSIRHYIDGEFVDSVDGGTFDVLDPVSNETYVQAAAGKQADIDRAVAAAKHAFDTGPWPRMKNRERSRILNRIADHVEARGDELVARRIVPQKTSVSSPISWSPNATTLTRCLACR